MGTCAAYWLHAQVSARQHFDELAWKRAEDSRSGHKSRAVRWPNALNLMAAQCGDGLLDPIGGRAEQVQPPRTPWMRRSPVSSAT